MLALPHHQIRRTLAWLVDAGPGVPPEVRDVLAAQLQTSRSTVVLAGCNSVLLDAVALQLDPRPVFVVLLLLNGACLVAGSIIRRIYDQALRAGRQPLLDAHVAFALTWCSLQGATAYAAMLSPSNPLRMVVGLNTLAIIGPTCARNYAAPRLALLMICLIDLPFAAGLTLCGDPWLLVLVAQTPVFLYGSHRIMLAFHRLAVTSLRAQHESRDRARRDPLTGLGNRLAFMDLVDRPAREDAPLTVLCLDLDGFKEVNDTFGHHLGDALLQSVARRLEAGTRPGDTVIRLGGDEFLVVAASLPADAASELADRLIERISGEAYLLEGGRLIRVGVSVGFACGPLDGACLETLHRRADLALYAAKAQGKGVAKRVPPGAAPAPPPRAEAKRGNAPNRDGLDAVGPDPAGHAVSALQAR